MWRHVVVAALAVALALPSEAHEGGHHVKGVVKEISETRLVVTDTSGKVIDFTLTAKTEFQRDKKVVGREAARVGERVVVHASMAGADMIATQVLLAGSSGH